MKKIYLSGPITGRKPMEALVHFELVKIKLENAAMRIKEKALIISPADLIKMQLEWESYMKIAKATIEDPTVDAVCMMRGWQDSDGCKQELLWAVSSGKTIIWEPGALMLKDWIQAWKGRRKENDE